MSARKPSPAEQPAPPPIPDGGLGEAMPEWLRRPPAWRDLAPKGPPRRALPPPDTSTIEPATLISVDDLPDWLRRLAKPHEVPVLKPATPPETPGRRVIPRVIEANPKPAPAPSASRENEEGIESGTRASAAVGPAPPNVPLVHSLDVSASPPRPPSYAILVLGTLLGVAVVVIIVLLVLLAT